MRRKLSFLLAVLLVLITFLPSCGNAFGTKIASVSVNGGNYYPIYVYQITDFSKVEDTNDYYNYNGFKIPYVLGEGKELSSTLYIVSQSKLSSDSICLVYVNYNYYYSGDSYVIQGTLKQKAVKEFDIQKKDNGDTFIITYYNFGSSVIVFGSKKEAEEAVQNTKTTVEVVKENAVIYYE